MRKFLKAQQPWQRVWLIIYGLLFISCGGGSGIPVGSGPSPVAPTFTQGLPATATVNMGAIASFPLTATGIPAPAISCSVTAGPGSASFTSGNALYTPSSPGSATVTCTASNGVGNPASTRVDITVPTPAPKIATTAPIAVAPGHAGFTLTVTGQNFVSGAVILIGGSARTTSFISATALATQIPAPDVATAGQLTVTVKNADNQLSNAVTVLVNSTVPVSAVASATITASAASGEFGRGVKSLGNVTGVAGQGDSAIAITSDTQSPTDTGVYVVFNPEKLSGSFTASQIGTAAMPGLKFIYTGPASSGGSFFAIAPVGDIDGDGINDFEIYSNAATSDLINKPGAGTVFVIKGGSWMIGKTTADLNDATLPIVRMEGVNKNAFAGQSLCDGADFNGDGKADACFAMPGYGFDPAFNSGPGAVFVLYGSTSFFSNKTIDLNQVGVSVPGFFITRDTARTPINLAGALGSTGPGSPTVFLADFNNDGLAELLIGDPAAQNTSPNTQKTYVVFGSSTLSGKVFIEDIGATFAGATLFTDRQQCTTAGAFCNQNFGSAVAARSGSIIVADQFGAIVGSSQGGMAFVYQGALGTGQNLDIRVLAANQQSSNLWNHSTALERFGFLIKDGSDLRLLSAASFDSNRGKVVIIPGSGLSLGNPDAATATSMSLIGENQGELLGVGLDRLPTAFLFSAPGNGGATAVPGKVYVVPNNKLLF
jgi:IPT/TIG domain